MKDIAYNSLEIPLTTAEKEIIKAIVQEEATHAQQHKDNPIVACYKETLGTIVKKLTTKEEYAHCALGRVWQVEK